MLARIANRKDPYQTASDLGLPCLCRPFWQASLDLYAVCIGLLSRQVGLEILEHLPYYVFVVSLLERELL